MREIEVKVGDSLSVIAQRELGDALRWPEIFDANQDHFTGYSVRAMMRQFPTYRPEDCIFHGQKLRIPGRA